MRFASPLDLDEVRAELLELERLLSDDPTKLVQVV